MLFSLLKKKKPWKFQSWFIDIFLINLLSLFDLAKRIEYKYFKSK